LLVCHCLGEKNIVIEKEQRHLALLLLLVRWVSVRAKANVPNIGKVYLGVYIMLYDTALAITFGGMCCWRRVAVARVFALVVRCGIVLLFCLFSRWQKP
jgi:hypothetical protein